VHVVHDFAFNGDGRTLVGCIVIIAFLDLFRCGLQGKEGEEMVDDVVLFVAVSISPRERWRLEMNGEGLDGCLHESHLD
jgi:hypothetical protein